MVFKKTAIKPNQSVEQGRAIARGIALENARKEKNQASAVKRQATMLERAAQKALSGGSAI